MTAVPVKLTKKYNADRYRKQAKDAENAHEWVSFEDPDDERIWMFDVTFLLSGWECIFGRGCQGVLTGPAAEKVQGCCSYGAHFADDDDIKRVEAYAKRLRPDQWQYYKQGQEGITKRNADGDIQTKLVNNACVFLNRPGFGTGPGCALHFAAVEAGEQYIDWEPEVCWQLPLHRDDETRDDGWVVTTISQWDRGHWGKGGHDFHWWCTEAPEAFGNKKPVYESMQQELLVMIGPKVYTLLAKYLETKRRPTKPIPHPVDID